VAQEAVRNAIRHADARHLSVRVRAVGDRLHLDVADDGIGFETRNGHGPGQPDESGGLGLRSLRDLIREAGGRLDVRTSVGEGTTVHLEVNR